MLHLFTPSSLPLHPQMALVSMRATSLVSIASFHSVYSQGNDKEHVKMTIEVKPGKGREVQVDSQDLLWWDGGNVTTFAQISRQ